MTAFPQNRLTGAYLLAFTGGQALHLHRILPVNGRGRRPPRVFVRAIGRGEAIAHLFDKDRARLEATARRLGVRVILVERPGTERQHIDLCGEPLRKACRECENAAFALAYFQSLPKAI